MTRSKKLLVLAGALALLAALTLLVTKLNSESDTVEDTYESVFTLETDSVNAFSWTYNGETAAFTKTDGEWSYDGDAEFPVNENSVETLLSSLSDIVAYKTIENAKDTDQYGLTEPACTISVSADSDYVIKLGNLSAIDSELYVSIGDGNVYLTDSSLLDTFSCSANSLVRKESIPDMSDIVSIEFSANDVKMLYAEESGYTYSDDYVWFTEDNGEYTALDTDNAGQIAYYFEYLSWGDCVSYNADEETLAEYGFDSPDSVVTVHYIESEEIETDLTDSDGNTITETQETEKTFIVEISCVDGNYYGKLPDSKMIYTIGSGAGESACGTTIDSLLPDELISIDMDTVSSIDVILDGASYTVERSYDEDSSSYLYYHEGSEVAFSSILNEVFDLTTAERTSTAASSEEELTLVFNRTDKEAVTLKFTRYSSSLCLATINGSGTQLVDRASIVSVASELSALLG